MRKIVMALVGLLVMMAPGASASESSEATFLVPTDPSRLVLSVVVMSPMTMHQRSALLYSDGRLELERTGENAREVQLSRGAVQSVLARAAAHHLMEWDGAAVRARMLRKDGKPRLGVSDANHVSVILSVDHYERGSIKIESVDRTISISGADTAKSRYPEIREFAGLVDLIAWMDQKLGEFPGEPE